VDKKHNHERATWGRKKVVEPTGRKIWEIRGGKVLAHPHGVQQHGSGKKKKGLNNRRGEKGRQKVTVKERKDTHERDLNSRKEHSGGGGDFVKKDRKVETGGSLKLNRGFLNCGGGGGRV